MAPKLLRRIPLFFVSALISFNHCFAQIDTLRLLSYNVLYLGDSPPCQGPHNVMEGYLENVISYANPDIAGFVKMEAMDASGTAPAHFADSILQYIFNAAYPGRYSYAPFTNSSGANNISMLFFDQQKLGYVNIVCSYANITDFDTYKLYYKTANLATTHDSIFLYVTLNHTNSGSGSSAASTRGDQIAGEMAQIETHFSSLPNMVNMGDFNVHNSSEACYQTLIAPANPNYRYYDPPFYPDGIFTYPADWDSNPSDYADYLTTSTRTGTSPNECSNDFGGGKSWYDHIFLSSNIVNKTDHIGYVPHSFRVIGNDGNRLGVPAIGPPTNTSAPAAVINSIYQISQHYPVALDLLVDTSAASAANMVNMQEEISVTNPVGKNITMRLPKGLQGKRISIQCLDMLGRVQLKDDLTATSELGQLPCSLLPGVYCLSLSSDGAVMVNMIIVKE